MRELGIEAGAGSNASLIRPAPPAVDPADAESADVWGFRDSGFEVNERGHVEARGRRYALSGQELPSLLPWMRDVLRIELDPEERFRSAYPTEVPASRADPALLEALDEFLAADQISRDPECRLRHGHGHTQEEMFAIKYGKIERVPDLVVYPASTEQVERLVELAGERSLCLIPYGGGTNVTDALRCPADEARPIASVDMSRMNRVEWIDPENHLACIQAGAVGRQLRDTLAEHGFTMGHEPDSVEFSTLGGWVATHASGMKKNRYGNIEALVLNVEAVTSQGVFRRSAIAPRESIGCDPMRWLFGSEGTLGIITRAVVKIFPLPEVQRYGSILLRDFPTGVAFLEALTRRGDLPASVRLVDNLQFQFGQALKPAARGWRVAKSRIERAYVTRLRGFDPQQMVACTLVFEGAAEQVRAQEKGVYALARDFGGMAAGSENGERGYQLTFGIAYIRDFAMGHYVLGESFETSVSWSRVEALCDNVKQRLFQEHAKRGLPGRPFVTCRVTQLYETGVCVYFYFAFYFRGVERPSETFAALEHAARDEILRNGGSLSHHHGVGKLRDRYLPEVLAPAALAWKRALKRAVDPANVFGCANQGM